ncbi:MAG: PAC2 family protein [Candidatus Woesearchaeota archaeon]|nr:PAC2 family protein [Candidatus Woesearchaeota archaeon]
MLYLTKKPKNAVVIEAFPGFGLVGTIAVEFLIEHLKTEHIGRISLKEEIPLVAIHEGKLVESMGVFYSKEYNIILIRSVNKITGQNFRELSEDFMKLEEELEVKEFVSLEGVNSPAAGGDVFFFCKEKEKEKDYESLGIKPLKEGIILGTTAALLTCLKSISGLFAETNSELPDSKASAELIKILDKRFSLKVDYQPLLDNAKKFENKLKQVIEKSRAATDEQEKKKLNYVG